MGFSLKKIGRGIGKLAKAELKGLKKIAKPALAIAAQSALGAATGGLPIGAALIAKTLAQKHQAAKKSKAVRFAMDKMAQMVPRITSTPAAETMPGGAPLPKRRITVPSKAKRLLAARAVVAGQLRPSKVKTRTTKAGVRTQTGGAPRKVPPGGLDLKRLSKMWKKAGKPGTWRGFVSANAGAR